MPSLSFPATAFEPRANLPAGLVQVIFTGFKPKLSKNLNNPSVNMNAILSVINDARVDDKNNSINGQRIFENLNLSFLPRLIDFIHAFGLEMVQNGDNLDIPGSFDGDTSDIMRPDLWGNYQGPLLMAGTNIATLELAEVPSRRKGAKPTDTQTDIKRYICAVPGCTHRHLESLLQS